MFYVSVFSFGAVFIFILFCSSEMVFVRVEIDYFSHA